jgi:tripartite-type tricarboxylate transporter receptor subunit TctC
MYDIIELNFNVGQAFYAPPDTDKGNLATLRKAFAAMLADPALAREIDRRRVEFQPQNADEVERRVIEGFKSAAPEVISRLKTIILGGKKKS